MHALDAPPMTDSFQLGTAVRSRSWEWLFALRKRLNVELQLVDDGQEPLLTAAAGDCHGHPDAHAPGGERRPATDGHRPCDLRSSGQRRARGRAADEGRPASR